MFAAWARRRIVPVRAARRIQRGLKNPPENSNCAAQRVQSSLTAQLCPRSLLRAASGFHPGCRSTTRPCLGHVQDACLVLTAPGAGRAHCPLAGPTRAPTSVRAPPAVRRSPAPTGRRSSAGRRCAAKSIDATASHPSSPGQERPGRTGASGSVAAAEALAVAQAEVAARVSISALPYSAAPVACSNLTMWRPPAGRSRRARR